MLTLRLLGSVLLEDPSGSVGGRVSQRRRLAVLALLGASDAPLTRAKILGLLWRDMPEDRGRHCLSDTLYVVRRALGEDALLASGDDLYLNPERIRVDLRVFQEAVNEGRDGEAVDLYRGPFLDGFYVSGAPDFDKWTDLHRRRLSELYGATLERLAISAEEDGRILDALGWWKRRAEHEPLNSRIAVRLMRMSAVAGDTAGALRHAGIHRQLLREEFDAEPPEEFGLLEEELRTPGVSGEPDPADDGDRTAEGEDPPRPADRRRTDSPGLERRRTAAVAERRPRGSGIRLRRLLPLGALLLVGALLTRGWLTGGEGTSGGGEDLGPLDPSVVTILPFRTSGAAPSLAFLGDGMVDLLEARFTGEGGPRAAHARAVLSRWRRFDRAGDEAGVEAGLRIARELRSGRLLTGSVIGNENRLVLTAALREVASGDVRARASVQGSFDELTEAVDRLAARFLAQETDESELALSDLTTASLPALRHYLEGQTAYRAGRPDEALSRFSRAVEADSTFALAALRAHLASTWIQSRPPFDAFGLAWRHRARLSERDRTFLVAEAGPDYPEHSSGAEMLAARQALVRKQPDSPEAWFLLGDFLVHFGAYQDMPDSTAVRLATAAFDRSMTLDSTYLPALAHLFDVAQARGDTAASRLYGSRYLSRGTRGLHADVIRNLLRLQSGGPAALPEVLARTDSAGGDIPRLTLMALHMGSRQIPGTDAMIDRLADYLPEPEMVPWAGWLLYGIARDRGRPAEATRFLAALAGSNHLDLLHLATLHVRDGLHYDGSAEAAARAAGDLEEMLGRPPDDLPAGERAEALCVLGQWRLAQGEPEVATPIIDRLRALGGDGGTFGEAPAFGCARLLATWRAVETDEPDARARLARLDSLLASGYLGPGRLQHEANLTTARLLERQGDLEGALRVLGRYPLYVTAVQYRPTFLRERGRVAGRLGDTLSAVDAYRRYLAVRGDPEPAVEAEVERVRGELARLTRTVIGRGRR